MPLKTIEHLNAASGEVLSFIDTKVVNDNDLFKAISIQYWDDAQAFRDMHEQISVSQKQTEALKEVLRQFQVSKKSPHLHGREGTSMFIVLHL
ncbi:hypothetical protein [Exiguobacterium sp.]|uniref:hypothetical protein n=1 Tax=Exiguobacterium sp. TaxID=44751 RepID=UPI000E996656|nr:hypothetical protein [Exiguobacterium sp.]HBF59764.1 hypothetical protein [Exiguobacterium sp.]